MGKLTYTLLPLSLLWGGVLNLRHWLFDLKIFPSYQPKDTFTVVVGNLNLGGTGKTPFTEFLIRNLYHQYNIAILSRGYGRKSKGFLEVEEGGSPLQFGDEPIQIKQNFPTVQVYVCEDRKKGIQTIIEKQKPDWIILDDAFQHRWVKGHVNILLSPFNKPYFKDWLVPTGKLRDVKSAAARADFIIATKGPKHIEKKTIEYYQRKTPFFYGEELFFSYFYYHDLINPKTHVNLGFKQIERVVLVSGVANPKPLIRFLENESIHVVHKQFPDHHKYSKENLRIIRILFDNFEGNKTVLVTTQKDYPKLKEAMAKHGIDLPFLVVPIQMHIADEKEKYFLELLDEKYQAFKAKI